MQNDVEKEMLENRVNEAEKENARLREQLDTTEDALNFLIMGGEVNA